MEADAMKIKRHIEKVHLAKEEKFTCNKCDAKCNSRQYLREHKHKEMGAPHNVPYVTKKSLEKGNLSSQEKLSRNFKASLCKQV